MTATDFQRLTYTSGRPPTLELEFRYRPNWTPPELWDTPVAVFLSEDLMLFHAPQAQVTVRAR